MISSLCALSFKIHFAGQVFISPAERHNSSQKPDPRDAFIEGRMAFYSGLFKLLPKTFTLLFIPKKHLYTDASGQSRFARTDMTQLSYYDKSGKLFRHFQYYQDWVGADGMISASDIIQIAQLAAIRMLSVMMQKRQYPRRDELFHKPAKPNLTYILPKHVGSKPRSDEAELKRLCEKYLPILQTFPNHAEMTFICKGAPMVDYNTGALQFVDRDTLVLMYLKDNTAQRKQFNLHYPFLQNADGILDKPGTIEAAFLSGIQILVKNLGADADVLPDLPVVESPKKT